MCLCFIHANPAIPCVAKMVKSVVKFQNLFCLHLLLILVTLVSTELAAASSSSFSGTGGSNSKVVTHLPGLNDGGLLPFHLETGSVINSLLFSLPTYLHYFTS